MDQQKNRRKPHRSNDHLISSAENFVPPHSEELEKTVLGVLLVEPKRMFDIYPILQEYDFYNPKNRAIYKAIRLLHERGQVADFVLTFEAINKDEESKSLGINVYELTKLTNGVVSGANVINYCFRLIEYSLSRSQLILFKSAFNKISVDNEDSFLVLEEAMQGIEKLKMRISNIREKHLIDFATNLVERFSKSREYDLRGETDPDLIYSGLSNWDSFNGSFENGMLYVIGARPGMGKTAFAIEVIRRVAARSIPVGFFNLEMTGEQVLERTYTNIHSVSNDFFKRPKGSIGDEEFQSFVQAISDIASQYPIFIDDNPNLSHIVNKMKYWVLVKGVKLIVLDYAQLISDDSPGSQYKNETQVLNDVLEKLRVTAKELNVPLILLAQLNRDNTKRTGSKEPVMSDLKGSGKFEECAYQIGFLHRPEYYDILEDEYGESTKGLCYLIIPKHRNGRTGRIKFRFVADKNQFYDYENSSPIVLKGSMLGSMEGDETPF